MATCRCAGPPTRRKAAQQARAGAGPFFGGMDEGGRAWLQDLCGLAEVAPDVVRESPRVLAVNRSQNSLNFRRDLASDRERGGDVQGTRLSSAGSPPLYNDSGVDMAVGRDKSADKDKRSHHVTPRHHTMNAINSL